jgi:lysophospholipase L1-like esterase
MPGLGLGLGLNRRNRIVSPPTPFSLSNLQLWMNGRGSFYTDTGGATLATNGQTIANAPDGSNNSRVLTQSTSGNRPALDTIAANGSPCLVSTAATKAMATGAWTNSQPYTIACVFKMDSAATGASDVLFDGISAASALYAFDGGGTNKAYIRANANLNHNWPLGGDGFGMLVAEFNGASSKMRWNGLTIETGSAGTSAPGGLTLFGLGGGGRSMSAKVAQLAVWSGTKITSDLTNLTALEAQWATDYGFSRYTAAEKRICFDGDSLTFGYQVALDSLYPVKLLQTLGVPWKGRNFAKSGFRVDQLSSDAASRVDTYYSSGLSKNILVFLGGINDILQNGTTGNSAATIHGLINTYCTNRRAAGWKVAVCTIPSGRNYSTAPGNFETYRTTINSSIVSNWSSYADVLVDLAADSRIGSADSGNDTNYFQADKLHWNAGGCTVVSGLVNSAISGLV